VSNATEADHADMTDPQRPPPSTSSPRTASGLDPRVERSRASVVDAAAQLLLAEGPDAITHARVADAATVSRTTVYKHYPERSDLLRATAQAVGKHLPDPASVTGDLRTDLRTLIGHLGTDLQDPVRTRVMAMMMERALHDEAVASVRDTFISELRLAFQAIIARAVDEGELTPDTDPDLGLASLAGSLLFSRFLASDRIDDDLADAVVDNFIRTNAPR
jgi:AcrR family transcriptional regulator